VKGQFHPKNDVSLNTSGNTSIRDVIDAVDTSRRSFLKAGAGTGAVAVFGGFALAAVPQAAKAAIPSGTGFAGIGFTSVPPNLRNAATGKLFKDLVTVPIDYTARVISAWGDPIMPGAPDWDPASTQDAAAQEMQVGMHHDGMHFFPFTAADGTPSSTEGLLVMNHEYTDENQLHGAEGLTGGAGVTIAKVRKS
jgi:hypothetical protein